MQVVGTRIAHGLPAGAHAVLRLAGGAQVDGGHQVLRRAQGKFHGRRHAVATHLVLAHHRAVPRQADLVAFVGVQRIGRAHARAPVGHSTACEGLGVVGGLGTRQIDDAGLARTHRATAAPVQQDAALGLLLLVLTRHFARLGLGGLGARRDQRQGLAHAHARRDGLAGLDAGAQAVVQGDINNARRHDGHGACVAIRRVAAASHARRCAAAHAPHEATEHAAATGQAIHLGHTGHGAGGQVHPQLHLGGLGVLGLGAQAGNAQAGGQAGRGQIAQRGCHRVCSRRYVDHPANHRGPQSGFIAAL